MSRFTTQRLIIETLNASQAQVLTAQELVDEMNAYYGSMYRQRLDNVSSKLKKMVDSGILLRVKGYGPRGGYGYLLNPNGPEEIVLQERDALMIRTSAERIRRDNASGPGN